MRLFGIIVLVLMGGCSTDPVALSQARQVPSDRLFGFQKPLKGGGVIVITRDTGYMAGGGCNMVVLVDGRKAARISTGEKVTLHVAAGRRILGISGDAEGAGLCSLKIGYPDKASSLEIHPGDTFGYRISGSAHGGLDIHPEVFY